MKAAILTFHLADNYGAVLQAYALQKTLLKLGVDNEILTTDFSDNVKDSGKSYSGAAAVLRNRILKENEKGTNSLKSFEALTSAVLSNTATRSLAVRTESMIILSQAAIRSGTFGSPAHQADISCRLRMPKSAFPMRQVSVPKICRRNPVTGVRISFVILHACRSAKNPDRS